MWCQKVYCLMGCACGKELIEINGRQFYIRKRLGEGGFSVVFLVDEKGGSNKTYACKRIICHSKRDEKRVLDEINVHSKFGQHAHIIPCEGYSTAKITSHQAIVYQSEQNHVVDSVEYNILLPYYRRGTLLDELTFRKISGDHISEQRVLKLFKGVCEAVKAFHSLEPTPYAHRDLKPGNVLLADDDNSVIMDLGSSAPARQQVNSSKEAQALQDYAAEHCSMPYRAPELFHVEMNQIITEKTDIWSLGCLLYAMCFFKSPFDIVYERGDSVALAVMAGNVQIPNDSPYSAELHQLILQMIRVEPAERPTIESIIEVVERLTKPNPNVA